MDSTLVAALLGLNVQTISAFIQAYSTFKKSNVEEYLELLLKEKKDLSSIGSNSKSNRLFFSIVDNVSKEVVEEKIKNWKNLTVKLASGFENDDFFENYVKILADLTAFDLMVLSAIYATNFDSQFFNRELIIYFEGKNIDEEKIYHSLKALSRYFLITEQADGMTYLYGSSSEVHGQKFFYEKNKFGPEFLKLVND